VLPVIRITYSVVVEVPPRPPTLSVEDRTRDTVQLVWAGAGEGSTGYILTYRPVGSQVYIYKAQFCNLNCSKNQLLSSSLCPLY